MWQNSVTSRLDETGVLSTRANDAISTNVQVEKHLGVLSVAGSWNIICVDVCMIVDGQSQFPIDCETQPNWL